MGCKLIIIETLTKKFTFQESDVNKQVKEYKQQNSSKLF